MTDTTPTTGLDRRLLSAGLLVTVALLVDVYADHHPGVPAKSRCPGCGFAYPDAVTDCPTNQVVRPLLIRRHAENRSALDRLTPDQTADLDLNRKTRPKRAPVSRSARHTPSPDRGPTLLDLINGKDSTS
ncbi:hypothetical protein [Luedemannella helvata]|uniref:Uncharacterized protein n=1 Tax=Luedemannella helvata TaxID=349315 RepID=A0ABP4XCS2_9ACTN